MNIIEILAAQAAERPTDLAIIDQWHCWRRNFLGREDIDTAPWKWRATTFSELDRAAARSANLLEQSGLRRGDPVLVFQPMSLELYVALLAVFRLGLVAMFLDPSAGREHIERCCALHAPRGFTRRQRTGAVDGGLIAPNIPVGSGTVWLGNDESCCSQRYRASVPPA